MIVRELITRLGFQVDTQKLTQAEKGIERIKTGAERMANTLRNAMMMFGVGFGAKQMLDTADQMQNFRSRMEMLPQTITSAAEAFDVVAQHANDAGMSIDAYAGMYLKLGNAAKELLPTQESILQVTDTLSKALVVGGASVQEQNAALMQFGQALGSGVLQGDEFRSMAEAAPQYLDELSKAMDIPRENLKKMAADGKLTAKAVIEATQKMAVIFDEKFKMMPMTVGRAMTIVQNRFALAIDHMNRKTLFVTKIAAFILAAFDKVADGIDWLTKKFGGLDNMLRLIGITIGVVFGAKALKVLSAFRLASLAAMLPFLKLAAIIGAVVLVVEDLMVWTQGGESLAGRVLGPWEDIQPQVMAVWDLLKQFGDWIATSFTDAFGGLKDVEWGTAIVAGLMMVADVVKWIGNQFAAVGAMLVGAFTLDWNLFKEGFMGAFNAIIAVLKTIGDPIWKSVTDAFDRLTTYVQNVFLGWAMSLSNALTGAFNAVKSALGFGPSPTSAPAAAPAPPPPGPYQPKPLSQAIAPPVVASAAPAPAPVTSAAPAPQVKPAAPAPLATTNPISLSKPLPVQPVPKPTAPVAPQAPAALRPMVTPVPAPPNALRRDAATMLAPKTAQPTVAPAQMAGQGVAPAQLSPAAMGQVRPTVNSTTNVNVTVPPGTSAEQAKFLEKSAQASFNKASDARAARDMAVYAT